MSAYLNTHHNRKYMVWNLSEHSYQAEIFSTQVIDYIFIGYPNPPLEVLFALCNSIKAWLDTDPDNIAVIHCQATRCRSIMILACFLAWNNSQFETSTAALGNLCKTLKLNISELMFPSQLRYMEYVDRILNGERVIDKQPVTKRITIDRIILNGIPDIEKGDGPCIRPYLQIFKGSDMVYSSSVK